MSAVEALSDTSSAPAKFVPDAAPVDMDAQLSAIFDRVETNNGSDRAEDGKFKSPRSDANVADALTKPVAETTTESVLEGAVQGEATEGDGSTLSPSVPLPPNWVGKDEVWSKVPDEIKADIATIQNDLHSRLSNQGREIAAAKPLTEAVSEFKHLFEGRIDPVEGIRRLAKAQENLDNPQTRLPTLLNIIRTMGAEQDVFAVLSGQKKVSMPQSPGITAQDIDRVVSTRLAEDRANQEANAEVSRLSQDKPLYAEIPETTMVQFINAAWSVLGEAASKDAVFNMAYDMATDSIPALKAKKVAAAKPALVPKPVSPEAAKRANSVNVTSTSTGKVREPSEDEQLEAIYDRNQRG